MRKDHSLEMDRRIRAEVELKRATSVVFRPPQEMQVPPPTMSTANVDFEAGVEDLRGAGAEPAKKPVRVVHLIERKREYWECSDSSSESDGESDTVSDEDDGLRFPREVPRQQQLSATQLATMEGSMDDLEEEENNLITASVASNPSGKGPDEELAVQPRPLRRSKRTRAQEGQEQMRAAVGLESTGQAGNSSACVSHSRKRKESSVSPPIRSSGRLGARSVRGVTPANHPKFAGFKVKVPLKQGRGQNEESSCQTLKSPDRHTKKTQDFVCRTCTRAFPHKSSLDRHMRTIHSNDRPFQCPQCPARFKLKYNIKQHMMIHSDRRPFKCSQCPERFKLKCNLKYHIMVHSDQRPSKCAKCPARFRNKNDLKSHMLYVHSKDRPVKCQLCGASFKTISNRNAHLQVHTGERPYSCQICGKSFTQARSLRTHVRERHAGGTEALSHQKR